MCTASMYKSMGCGPHENLGFLTVYHLHKFETAASFEFLPFLSSYPPKHEISNHSFGANAYPSVPNSRYGFKKSLQGKVLMMEMK